MSRASVADHAAAWASALPGSAEYLALPSRSRPVVVAQRDPQVLDYLREALLAAPPGGRVPPWAVEVARAALRRPVLWRMAPRWAAGLDGGSDDPLRRWISSAGHRVLLLNHSHDPDRRYLLLLFPPGCGEPMLALKVADGAAAALRLAAEEERLRAVYDAVPADLRHTVPWVLDEQMLSALPILVTAALPGVPMLVGYYRRGHTSRPHAVNADLQAASAWLTRLQAGTAGASAPLDFAAGTLRSADERATDQSLGQLSAVAARLRRYRAAQVAVHGDFWAGNILLRDGCVTGVVDWERFCPAGNPARDVTRFALTYATYLPALRGSILRPEVAASYLLDGVGWLPTRLRRFITDLLNLLGLPAAVGPDMVLAELLAIGLEATDDRFARRYLQAFDVLARRLS
jgi:aminoglycoside phosphotransferase